jgi:hypothetical protein
MAPGRVAIRHVCGRRRPVEAGPWQARPGVVVAPTQLVSVGVRAWRASPTTEFVLHVAVAPADRARRQSLGLVQADVEIGLAASSAAVLTGCAITTVLVRARQGGGCRSPGVGVGVWHGRQLVSLSPFCSLAPFYFYYRKIVLMNSWGMTFGVHDLPRQQIRCYMLPQ